MLKTEEPAFRNFYPGKEEFIVVGAVGICLYVSLALLAGFLLYKRVKNKTSKKFFVCVIIMSICELPRYFDILCTARYSNTYAYSIHLMAATFCFAAFSIVCYQWAGLLELGTYTRKVYSAPALIAVNALFTANDLLAATFCATASSLNAYFVSTSYEVYILTEAARNLVYSAFLSYYGVRLISRFWHFSQIDGRNKNNLDRTNVYACICCEWLWNALALQGTKDTSPSNVFITAVVRLTIVLLISTCCFTLRIIMLLLKVVALHDHSFHVTSTYFTLFGLCWYTLTDFIPRVIPNFVFMLLMQTNRAKGSSRPGSFTRLNYKPSSHSQPSHIPGIDKSPRNGVRPEQDSNNQSKTEILTSRQYLDSFLSFYKRRQDRQANNSTNKNGHTITSIHPLHEEYEDEEQDSDEEKLDELKHESDTRFDDAIDFWEPGQKPISSLWRTGGQKGLYGQFHHRLNEDDSPSDDSQAFSQSMSSRLSTHEHFTTLVGLMRPASSTDLESYDSNSIEQPLMPK